MESRPTIAGAAPPAGRLDVDAAWRRLSAGQQAAIGVAAITAMLGDRGRSGGMLPPTGYEAAAVEGEALLAAAVARVLPDAWANHALPDLALLGIRTCGQCGCTDACGCPEPCCWVGAELCSGCLETGPGAVASAGSAPVGSRP